MNWDENTFGITYSGSLPLDSSSPPAIGNVVRLKCEEIDFEVSINSIDGTSYVGTVQAIGPIPEIEALGIQRGEEVEFQYKHIKSISR